ncbi:hypothetical protein PTTG_02384 [Puccinia triticina 1-1 BBBD Race 1]|uniref:RIBOSOMAL_L9 domain-containing protein n=2 Tax=Puccinia triticina TaxID=208348 RepID=A0A0C4ENN7_PUCT1|nr:uncharacterized protein PtA15_4A240 [Puccinia triticina]OAV99085.1 hypothetical protein PTTG_02384 [Puccinia triticina 1-1 BBBD Race 1]WAQ83791.1 hypothetical protein PtA15_4A240 [Puccinia triticina]WAR54633.1 hypothetical protein PtB15_4B250 [Puccinia triticina]
MTLVNSASGPLRASTLQLPAAASSSRWFSSTPCPSVWVQKRIKVQLRTDHPSHGKAGQVIRVKPGHMRQQLFPSGQALYCAKDGIPIHHYQPSVRPGTKVPAPGLSRPLVDILKRLGVQMPITRNELREAQSQINQWKRAANPSIQGVRSPTPAAPVQSVLSPHSGPLSPPKGLAQALQTLSQTLQSTQEPLLVFKRSGPETSDSLYSSIKADEIIASLVDKLEFKPDQTSEIPPLAEFLKIAGCSDSLQELSPQSSAHLDPLPRFKPIKRVGHYRLSFSLNASSHHPSKDSDLPTYSFPILVEK